MSQELCFDSGYVASINGQYFKTIVCDVFQTKFHRRLIHGLRYHCLKNVKWREESTNRPSVSNKFAKRQLADGDTEYIFIANSVTPIRLLQSERGIEISVDGKIIIKNSKESLELTMQIIMNTKLCNCRKSGACLKLLSSFTKADICRHCKQQQAMTILRDSTNKRQGGCFCVVTAVTLGSD